ncbi:MAG: M24 family metallopeptidase [Candidatus Enteromonas sp.]|nr:M24 family metallopeptidase [Candidatus Enteromonas sp.]
MNKDIYETRINQLRKKLLDNNLKGYLISTGDPHISESPSSHYASLLSYYCPFKGENADVFISLDKAILFVDGRFGISAKKDVEGTPFEVIDTSKIDTPLEKEIKEMNGYPLGLDFSLFPIGKAKKLSSNGEIFDLKDEEAFKYAPKLSSSPLFELDEDATTLDSLAKINVLREKMKSLDLDGYVVSDLNEIAYLTNLRGDDLPYTPVFYAYLFVSLSNAYLFFDTSRFSKSIKGVDAFYPYSSFSSFLEKTNLNRIGLDINSVNYEIDRLLKDKAVYVSSLIELDKAIKGEKEIKNTIKSQIEDGVALTKFIIHFKDEVKKGSDEQFLSNLLHSYREKGTHFIGESFENIVAVDSNSACMHYAPSEEIHSKVDSSSSSLLIDSGGQYKYGTTDTTRTFALSKPSEEFKKDYTLTLKCLIALSKAIFLDGANGRSLDGIARKFMWQEGMDYKCGTGHGVSYLGPVHEGPNGFRYKDVYMKNDGAKIVPGMVTTVEPGVYKENKYGIRIENDLLCVPYISNGFGTFYKFKTITYAPIELDSVELSMLDKQEKEWLNAYHKEVYELLSPFMDKEEVEVLKYLTRSI